MLNWSFYLGAIVYSFLILLLFSLILIIFDGGHSQGNGFHLAILQTVITLCTLTSIFTAVREQTKKKLENILIEEIFFVNPSIMNFIRDSVKNELETIKAKEIIKKSVKKKIKKEIEKIFKSLIYLSSFFILIAIFAIGMDCENCIVHYSSLILFFPTVFLCVIFLKIEYIVYLSTRNSFVKKFLYKRTLKDFKISIPESAREKIQKINIPEQKKDMVQPFLDKVLELYPPKPISVRVIYHN